MNNKETLIRLAQWQRILLSEASTISYRLLDRNSTDQFYDDLASSLEQLAKRIRREISSGAK